jgi:RNA polymerase sigma factor (sigma-70 family)
VLHEHIEATLHHLQTLFDVGVTAGLTDGELLEQFARRPGAAAEIAFETLVERHGSMVLRVCRGIVGNDQDAEDAFQATFFILARKSDGLWVRDSLAPWLHRVACRAAARVKSSTNRQRAIERRAAQIVAGDTEIECRDDWGQTLHEEVDRLPQYYRLPVVLCDLEGHSYETASRFLGCPIGTVKSRLARGRERLRHQLVRRGVAPSAGAIIPPALVPETIPAALWKSTIENVMRLKPGTAATTGAFSASVSAISEGVLKAMLLTKIRMAIAMTLVAGAAVAGLAILVRGASSEPLDQATPKPEPSKAEISATPASPAAKPTSTVVPPTAAASEPQQDSFEAPQRVTALGDIHKIWAYDPKSKTWHTYTAPKGVTIHSATSRSGQLVALMLSGEPILEIAVFAAKTGKWSRQALAEPAPIRNVEPVLGNNYAVYLLGRHAYAFSNATGKWSEQSFKEPGQQPYIQIAGRGFAIYHDSRSIYAFSASNGTWQTMEVEQGTSAQLEAGPANTVLIVNGGRLYSYDPNKARFEEVKTNED